MPWSIPEAGALAAPPLRWRLIRLPRVGQCNSSAKARPARHSGATSKVLETAGLPLENSAVPTSSCPLNRARRRRTTVPIRAGPRTAHRRSSVSVGHRRRGAPGPMPSRIPAPCVAMPRCAIHPERRPKGTGEGR